MVKTTLVEADLIAGWRLLLALEIPPKNQELFRVKAAFWLYSADSEEWRLMIATPLVDEKGPLNTYAQLQPLLLEIQPADLYLQNIAVISPSDPLAKAFRRAMHIPPKVPYVRVTRSTVGGIYVEDAYLYRLPPPLDPLGWSLKRVGAVEKRDAQETQPRHER